MYISYNCVKKNGTVSCKNPGIRRDDLEQLILKKLSETVFNQKILPVIIDNYNTYALSRNKEYLVTSEELKRQITEVDKGISNIVDIVVKAGSVALTDKLKELEENKVRLEQALLDAQKQLSEMQIDENKLKVAFKKAKQMLRSSTLKNRKAIIEKYIKRITVFTDRIEVEYNISDTYSFKEEVKQK